MYSSRTDWSPVVARHLHLPHAQDALLGLRPRPAAARRGRDRPSGRPGRRRRRGARSSAAHGPLPPKGVAVPAARAGRWPHPEDEVGEGQVGNQLPVTNQQVQPLDLGVAESGPAAQELTQCCHTVSLCVVSDDRADRPCHMPLGERTPSSFPVSGGWGTARRSRGAQLAERDDFLRVGPAWAPDVLPLVRLLGDRRLRGGRVGPTARAFAGAFVVGDVGGDVWPSWPSSPGPSSPWSSCWLAPLVGRTIARDDGAAAAGVRLASPRVDHGGLRHGAQGAERDRQGGDARVGHPLDTPEGRPGPLERVGVDVGPLAIRSAARGPARSPRGPSASARREPRTGRLAARPEPSRPSGYRGAVR